MRFFLINLDRDQDRLDYMMGEMTALGLEVERISACYGLDIPVALKPYFLDAAGNIASAMNKGEVGCYASHLAIMHRIIEENINEPVCVLEDDLEFHDTFAQMCTTLEKLPDDWDIVRLSNPSKSAFQTVADLSDRLKLVKYWRVPNNTGCYLISRRGAEKFLAYAQLRKRAVDEDLRRPWEHGLATYGLLPPPVTSNIFDSSLASIGGERSMPGRKRFKDAGGSFSKEWAYRIQQFGLLGSIKAMVQTRFRKNRIWRL